MINLRKLIDESMFVTEHGVHRYASELESYNAFTEKVVQLCVDAVDSTDLTDIIRTTYDEDQAKAIKSKIVESIKGILS